MEQSIKSKLSISIAFIVVLTVLLISILSNLIIKNEFTKYKEKQQLGKIEEIVNSIQDQYNIKENKWDEKNINNIGISSLNEGYIIKIYNKDNSILWDAKVANMQLCKDIMDEICKVMENNFQVANGKIISEKFELTKFGNNIGNMEIEYYGPFFLSQNDSEFIKSLNYIFIVIGIVSFIIAIWVGSILSKNISKPISKMIGVTKHIANGEYEYRFDKNTKIKELSELQNSINLMADSIENQENLRKQLTADMAHELRTPLTSVSTHLEAMITGLWEPSNKRLESCYEELNRITTLVKDLEKLANVENGCYKLQKVQFDMFELLKKVSYNFEYKIKEKKIKFELIGEKLIIEADQDRIYQVITNILSNAIKYTNKEDKITIKLYKESEYAVCEIIDTGIGISQNELPYIFERFYRADKSRNRKTGGAGIGLAIVKSILQAHNGKIQVNSQLGKGSSFKVFLPL